MGVSDEKQHSGRADIDKGVGSTSRVTTSDSLLLCSLHDSLGSESDDSSTSGSKTAESFWGDNTCTSGAETGDGSSLERMKKSMLSQGCLPELLLDESPFSECVI